MSTENTKPRRTNWLDEMSPEERGEWEAKFARKLIAINKAHEVALSQGFKRGHGGAGKMPCPADGCAGDLHFTVAGCNGHMHAVCTQPNCLSWME